MKILAAKCLLVLVLCAVQYSHQLDQREALRLFLKARQSHVLPANYSQWLTSPSLSSAPNIVSKSQDGWQDADRIDPGLPGQPPNVGFAQYSGYVTVDSSAGRALFYYFAEATTDPSTKPLLLWLNGGPGCSSFGVGAMEELGPFRVNPDGKTLHRNPYAWNQVANTLFLESPAGVGFSYSNTTSDYDKSGDQRTAEDSYAFLVNWFERFPQYKNRDFYIAGESYAGNYIPELTVTILYHKKQSEASFINLKGIMVGNGLMNLVTDYVGKVDFLWSHALISDQTHEGALKYCNFTLRGHASTQCKEFAALAHNETGNIDPYNIYAPLCLQDSSQPETSSDADQLNHSSDGYDPCSSNYIKTYLNTLDVQEALHANVTGLPYPWDQCSSIITKWRDGPPSMLPFHREIIKTGLRILIYSGDVDSVIPVTSTRYSINALKLPVETPWYPWMNGGEVGGYSVIYKGLTFATVRGAGHEVPSFQPARALTLLTFFLAGKPLPNA